MNLSKEELDVYIRTQPVYVLAGFAHQLTDEQIETFARKNAHILLSHYESVKHRVSRELFECCVRKNPKAALTYHDNIGRWIDQELFDYCLRREPRFILRSYLPRYTFVRHKKSKNSYGKCDRVTDEQFDYCVRSQPKEAILYYKYFASRITNDQIFYCLSKCSHVSDIYNFNYFENCHIFYRYVKTLNDYFE